MDARSDPSKLKFHGKLETPDYCFSKYDKEEFLQSVKEQVPYYGLKKFFVVHTAGGTINNLIMYSCLFELYDILK